MTESILRRAALSGALASALTLAFLHPLPSAAESADARPAAELVVLNEFLADPPPDLEGDANGDGVRSSADDEFIEIYNAGTTTVDLSGWTIQDATSVRHTFEAGFTLAPGDLYVVFGGGAPTGIPSGWALASSGGLSLNNTADEVKLVDAATLVVDTHPYGPEGNEDQSVLRFPDGTGAWTLPADAGLPWNFSPGELNSSPTSVEASSWGKVKANYRE